VVGAQVHGQLGKSLHAVLHGRAPLEARGAHHQVEEFALIFAMHRQKGRLASLLDDNRRNRFSRDKTAAVVAVDSGEITATAAAAAGPGGGMAGSSACRVSALIRASTASFTAAVFTASRA
jgi:hypothetical protein